MHAFFAEFRIVGEIVDYLYCQHPAPRLLVDLSLCPNNLGNQEPAPTASRISTEISDDRMAGQFLRSLHIGDVVEVSGVFSQGDYVPHRTTHVDTTFKITAFQALETGDDLTKTSSHLLPGFTTAPIH